MIIQINISSAKPESQHNELYIGISRQSNFREVTNSEHAQSHKALKTHKLNTEMDYDYQLPQRSSYTGDCMHELH